MFVRKNIIIIFILLAHTLAGQIHITPFVGINSTRLKLSTGSFSYKNGGNFPFGGIEIEGRLKPHKISPIHVSFVTGATYLANGYYENVLFSLPSLNYYTASTVDLTTTYVQIPLMLKLNWQPFPLLEDFRFFLGGGVSSNTLLKAHLTEKVTKVFKSSDPFVIPQTTQYQDSKDVTDLGVKNSLFTRIDIGLKYRKVQIAFRLSVSIQDMYFKGLEKSWAIPAKESAYISGHTAAGTTNEKYSELTIGYTLF